MVPRIPKNGCSASDDILADAGSLPSIHCTSLPGRISRFPSSSLIGNRGLLPAKAHMSALRSSVSSQSYDVFGTYDMGPNMAGLCATRHCSGFSLMKQSKRICKHLLFWVPAFRVLSLPPGQQHSCHAGFMDSLFFH